MSIVDGKNLSELFAAEGIILDDKTGSRFSKYASLLVEWNEKINLTAITDGDGIAKKHFLDSVLPLKLFNIPENAKVIDVGTGAGFPGIPYKIMREDIDLTLLDSLQKRLTFLNEVLTSLDITAETVHGRAEDLGQSGDFREKYDIATARAVAKLSVLCEYCLPFVKVGGYFLALKGADGEQEVKDAYTAIKTLGGKLENTVTYTLPDGEARALVIIKKVSPTPAAYPRPKGKMNRKPL